ncbi:hypothetical protein E6P78_04795 [Streptomyces sp. A0958]|uniref:anti-sigma factor family protein n=1 Tax=Streptomyces sp. A0958 TaxID=2563101 RepID=UPI00109E4620|nr:hypothetical protein [Streptomyces sp. A0958]THA71893.1 hypothetical protein E6P78_04795 [Streptomyces sp. A0958]
MTSTADTAQHPDVSEISDLTEGLLSETRAAEVRGHTAGCDLCTDVLASLEEIRGLLSDLPAPEPMPADVAARIDAALADEARTRTEPDAVDDVSRETEPRPIAPEPPDRPTGHPRAATGPGRRPGRRRRRTTVLATALGAAAMVGVSVLLLQNVSVSQSNADAGALRREATAPANNAQAFSQSTLAGQVHDLLSSGTDATSPQNSSGKEQAPSVGAKSSSQTDPSDSQPSNSQPSDSVVPESPLRSPAVTIPSCVEEGIGRNTAALAIEKGTYEGTAAFLVVLPHLTDATRVQAYVVDAACVDAEPPAKGRLLLTHAYARP